jgi:hypothetical protein
MKQPKVFIFEDRTHFKNIYSLNLLAYLNADVKNFYSFDHLIDSIKTKCPDAVYLNLKNEDEDIFFYYHHEIKKLNSKPITLVQSKGLIKEVDYKIVNEDLSVRDFIQTFSKEFGVTAKSMADQKLGEYFCIPIEFISTGLVMGHTIYTKKAGEQYIPFLYQGEKLTNELLLLISKENYIYCKSIHRLDLINQFTSDLLIQLQNENATLNEKIINTDTAFNLISLAVSNIGLPAITKELVKSTVSVMENIITQNASLHSLYLVLKENSLSLRFKHSLIICHIGQYVLNKQGWNTNEISEQWTYLSFFHDIFIEQDSWLSFESDEELMSSKLEFREKNLIQNHARLASQLIASTKDLPSGVENLILQHHGAKMGDSLNRVSVSLNQTSILFCLVEEYVQFLLSKKEVMKSNKEIHDFIDGLYQKYPFPNYKKFISVLKSIPVME